MRTFHTRLSIAVAILLVGFANRPAFARGSQVLHDDPWNTEHIERLPPEVRNAIIRMCGDARAGHYFATYFDNSRLMKLHFEHLHCADEATYCRQGSCLHQEYISAGGHYRLIRSYYGRKND
jgi:hypothetical protein